MTHAGVSPDVRLGDCIEAMKAIEAGTVDAVVCDPPYGLEFMGKDWDAPWKAGSVLATAAEAGGFQRESGGNPFSAGRIRYGRGSGGESQAFQAWTETWAAEALRILKPGGHLLAFGGTRTYHRLASGIEDAGFEIRDCIAWMYGSGFPKSHDVAKAIDRAAGERTEPIGTALMNDVRAGGYADPEGRARSEVPVYSPVPVPVTAAAAAWAGWGTALKPAFEPVIVARKPLEGTVAANVVEHGTGAINIDGCRVEFESDDDEGETKAKNRHADFGTEPGGNQVYGDFSMVESKNYDATGRWPANVVLDPEAAALLDEQTGELSVGHWPGARPGNTFGFGHVGQVALDERHEDGGGPSRFFYCAKTSQGERAAGIDVLLPCPVAPCTGCRYCEAKREAQERANGSNPHPTVKPIALMRWLVRLVTPPGGLVVDPFLGSGSTGIAAHLEGMRFVGIEREIDYLAVAEARIRFWIEHGEAALEIVADRDAADRERQARADAGQLDLFAEA